MPSLLEDFMAEINETIHAEGGILVGHFVWILRGMDRGLTNEQMEELSRQAYKLVRERYPLRLVWSAWPTDVSTAVPALDDTPLEFDLDPDGSVDEPILYLTLD